MRRLSARLTGVLMAASLPVVAAAPEVVVFPPQADEPPWVESRRAAQLAAGDAIPVFHGFTFADERERSGIDFLHRVVDDAAVDYKAVHYDHGNAVAAADVDGDGRIDLYFVSQVGPNALYRNLGGGQFENVTAVAGVGLAADIGVAASFADIDNDGDADLYVTNVRSANRLFLNDGTGRFADVSSSSGIDVDDHSSAATFFDYDRDGLVDLFLAIVGEYTTPQRRRARGTPASERPEEPMPDYYVGHRDAFAGHVRPGRDRPSRLFRNLGGGRFEDVSEAVGLLDLGWSGDASPVDFDRDGWPDLYVLNMQGHDHFWRNDHGKRFVDESLQRFPRTPWGSMGVKSFDYDNDGDIDLLLTDMHSDMSEKIGVDREKRKADWITRNWSPDFLRSEGRSIYGNALFRNDSEHSFTEVSDELNVENYWPWGLSVGDLNADGWQDVFITASMNYPFRYGPNTALLNGAGERFHDAEYILGIEPRATSVTKPWFELDCAVPAERENGHCEGRDRPLAVHGVRGSRSSLIVDLDDDGDLDIVTAEFGDRPQILISNLSERRGRRLTFLKLALRGTASNRDALGSRVTVTAGGQRYVQVNDGKSGYLAQSSIPLYFGLGDAHRIDRIEVAWPAGGTSALTDIPAPGQVLLMVEPGSEGRGGR